MQLRTTQLRFTVTDPKEYPGMLGTRYHPTYERTVTTYTACATGTIAQVAQMPRLFP